MKGKSLTLIGTAMTLALTSNVAMAESSKSLFAESSNSSIVSPTEIKMSLEGMKILCERFPLNSRCPGGIPLDANFITPATAPETNSINNNTNLDTTTVPLTPTTPSPDNSSQPTPAPLTPTTPSPDNSSQPTPAPLTPTTPSPDNSSQLTPAPLTPTTPSPDNSSQPTPVPESSSSPEFGKGNSGEQGGGLTEQVPVNILPQTPPSGM
ncbi:hypothetical protein H6G06_26365 [Anabaena sphaerica FACHB-251]|uniref:Uncharacterized protein n=1 Tax=Anabaena sphaerica FACHB-251 TaxID=2692883 RepID=A0A926WMV2_9NOST|nr:hypothetical protein [Anabaena sphaerica]MBD2296905.1 hypothetical protein [Anabaena sphaerica FACHB-251]